MFSNILWPDAFHISTTLTQAAKQFTKKVKQFISETVYLNQLSTIAVELYGKDTVSSLNVFFFYFILYRCLLTLKAPRKPAPENVVCLCRLLNILANFSNLVLHTGKPCGP